MTKKKKIIIIISILLVSAVLVYHIIWYVNFKSYDKYAQANAFIHEDYYYYSSYINYENNRTYSVAAPSYPQFTGNLGITPILTNDLAIGDNVFNIIIWPKPFGHFEVGIAVSTVTEMRYIESIGSWKVEFENNVYIHLDENMQPLDDNDEESLQAYEDNIEQIKCGYQMAHDMWGILKVE